MWHSKIFLFFAGKVLQHLFGICTEALYCGKAPSARCIWRPGALPNECELFYGFSRYFYIFLKCLFWIIVSWKGCDHVHTSLNFILKVINRSFTSYFRFAIELNEILESERHFLPQTDTRFRPDQRALEVSLMKDRTLISIWLRTYISNVNLRKGTTLYFLVFFKSFDVWCCQALFRRYPFIWIGCVIHNHV